MNVLQCFLLAQHNRLDALSDGFRTHTDSTRDDLLIGLLILATVGAGVWAATRLLTSRTVGQAFDNSWRLFYDLCKAHRLNWSERSLLRRLATQHGMKDPARIFLESDRWEPNRLPVGIRHEFNRLNVLRKRLFEAPPAQVLGKYPTAGKLPASKERVAVEAQDNAQATAGDTLQDTVQDTAQSILPPAYQEAELSEIPLMPQPSLASASRAPLATKRGASPLLPPLASPTLDLPPWTASK